MDHSTSDSVMRLGMLQKQLFRLICEDRKLRAKTAKELKDLEYKEKKLESELGSLREQAQEHKKESQTLAEDRNRVRAERQDVTEQLSTHTQEVDSLKRRFGAGQDQLKNFELLRTELQNEKTDTTAQIERLTAAFETLDVSLSDSFESFNGTRTKLQSEHADRVECLKSSESELMRQISECQTNVMSEKNALNFRKSERSTVSDQLKSVEEEKAAIVEEIRSLRTSLAEAEEQFARMQLEIGEQQRTVSDQINQIATTTDENQNFIQDGQDRLDKLMKAAEDVVAEDAGLDKEVELLEARRESSRAGLKETADECEALTAKIKSSDDINVELLAEKSRLFEELAIAQSEIDDLKLAEPQLVAELANLDLETSEMEAKIAGSEISNEKLESAIEETAEHLKEAEMQKEDVQKDIASLEAEKLRLNAALISTEALQREKLTTGQDLKSKIEQQLIEKETLSEQIEAQNNFLIWSKTDRLNALKVVVKDRTGRLATVDSSIKERITDLDQVQQHHKEVFDQLEKSKLEKQNLSDTVEKQQLESKALDAPFKEKMDKIQHEVRSTLKEQSANLDGLKEKIRVAKEGVNELKKYEFMVKDAKVNLAELELKLNPLGGKKTPRSAGKSAKTSRHAKVLPEFRPAGILSGLDANCLTTPAPTTAVSDKKKKFFKSPRSPAENFTNSIRESWKTGNKEAPTKHTKGDSGRRRLEQLKEQGARSRKQGSKDER